MTGVGIDWSASRARLDDLARRLSDTAGRDAAILTARAARLAEAPGEVDADRAAFVVFRRGDARFAVPLAQARETPAVRTLLPLPCVPPHIRGLALAKGQLLPVVELSWFVEAPIPRDVPALFLVAEVPGQEFALAADEIEGVRDLRPLAAAAALRGIGKVRPFVSGITEEMVTMVDLSALAMDARFVVNDEVGGKAG